MLLGLIDSLVAASLSLIAVNQAGFIPQTDDACRGATDWKNGTDGRNYFLVANATAFDSYKSPAKLSRTMVQIWTSTVIVV